MQSGFETLHNYASQFSIQQACRFLDQLPLHRFAILYGSAAFPNNIDGQCCEKEAAQRRQIDILIGVDDVKDFIIKSENIKSSLKGLKYINFVEKRMFLPIFIPYLTDSSTNDIGAHFKVGIFDFNAAIEDLKSWKYFILAPRLTKPFIVLSPGPIKSKGDEKDFELFNYLQMNLKNAINTALIASLNDNGHPNSHQLVLSYTNIFTRITSLSYFGDIRMICAEDKNKIANIVKNHYEMFQIMYRNIFEDLQKKKLISILRNDKLSLNRNPSTIFRLSKNIPKNIRQELHRRMINNSKHILDFHSSIDHMISDSSKSWNCLSQTLQSVLYRKSFLTSVKLIIGSILTLKIKTNAAYLLQKMKKFFTSKSSINMN
ncbi:MAG: hypothetical protein MHMPM18_002663 [Marteilia pararefringens]